MSELLAFNHLSPSVKNKIIILLQADKFTEAKQVYEKAKQNNQVEKSLSQRAADKQTRI